MQIRPFDDEIPPPPAGSFDIDSILNQTSDDEDKKYSIGKTSLDKITYEELHRYDTYEKALTQSFHQMPNFMGHKLTKGEKWAGAITFFSSLGLAATFDYQ